MQLLLLSCYKATELIEKKLDFKLTFKEKIQLEAHKRVCSACRNYEKQSHFMNEALKHTPKVPEKNIDLSGLKKETLAKLEKNE